MKTTMDPCARCNNMYYMHGANGMCPPYVSNCTTFLPVTTDKIHMKATDLALAFEQEWTARYPEMRYFTVNCAVRDIAHHRNAYISSEAFDGLESFLTKYLKEHPDRYEYAGSNSFRVIANSPSLSRQSKTSLSKANKKLQQSPN